MEAPVAFVVHVVDAERAGQLGRQAHMGAQVHDKEFAGAEVGVGVGVAVGLGVGLGDGVTGTSVGAAVGRLSSAAIASFFFCASLSLF